MNNKKLLNGRIMYTTNPIERVAIVIAAKQSSKSNDLVEAGIKLMQAR